MGCLFELKKTDKDRRWFKLQMCWEVEHRNEGWSHMKGRSKGWSKRGINQLRECMYHKRMNIRDEHKRMDIRDEHQRMNIRG